MVFCIIYGIKSILVLLNWSNFIDERLGENIMLGRRCRDFYILFVLVVMICKIICFFFVLIGVYLLVVLFVVLIFRKYFVIYLYNLLLIVC